MWTKLEELLTARSKVEWACWLWTGTVRSGGYGQVEWRGKKWIAHRLSYMLDRRTMKLPEDAIVYQICGNKLCINPEHLVLTTREEYSRQNATARNAHKTHCPHGHPYIPGKRRCRECFNAYMRRYQKDKRASNGTGTGNGVAPQGGVVGSDQQSSEGRANEGGDVQVDVGHGGQTAQRGA